MVSFGLGSLFGWRSALFALGLAGLGGLALLATQRDALRGRAHGVAPPRHTIAASVTLFRQPQILLCFAYFCVMTIATIAVQTFAGTVLNAAYAVPLAVATSAITAYLLGSTAGILTGGFLAARTKRHDRVAASGIAAGASLMLLLAIAPALASFAIALFALAGFSLGATGPSRDMIVRNATPSGASGRVYGFVYSGLDLGATLSPVAIGFVLDHGSARIVFAAIACFLFLAIATVVQVRRSATLAAAGLRAAD